MRTKITAFIFAIALTLVCGRANATGFLVQPAVAFGSSLVPAPSAVAGAMSTGEPTATFTLAPIVRLGASLPWLAVALDFSYTAAGVIAQQGDFTSSIVQVGVDFEPYVWRTRDRRARIYALLAVNALALGHPSTGPDWGAGFTAGVGGNYFLHPAFAVGAELAVKPQFVPLANNVLLVDTNVYVALTLTFETGHHFVEPRP